MSFQLKTRRNIFRISIIFYFQRLVERDFKESYPVKNLTFDSYMLPDSDLPFGGFRLLEVDNRVKLLVEIHTRVLITATDVLHS